MSQIYFELRPSTKESTSPIAADIARHLQARQYLGTAVIVCDNPIAMLSATRKQWLRLARNLQKQRASTLNAEEILRFTHTIMHMQHLQFTAKSPAETSDCQIYFVTPSQLQRMPRNCFSLYLTTFTLSRQLQKLLPELPYNGLIINYDVGVALSPMGILPKNKIELKVQEEWTHITGFLRRHQINIDNLVTSNSLQLGAMDDALDTLLDVSNEFLRDAAAFQHAINLAQPLNSLSAKQHRQFEAVTRLAHRVQALTPGSFNSYLIKTFGDKDASTYFLRDAAPEEDDEYSDKRVSTYILSEVS